MKQEEIETMKLIIGLMFFFVLGYMFALFCFGLSYIRDGGLS
jgi:hypothetical protein